MMFVKEQGAGDVFEKLLLLISKLFHSELLSPLCVSFILPQRGSAITATCEAVQVG